MVHDDLGVDGGVSTGYTFTETARLIGVDQSTLLHWIRHGDITTERDGRTLRVTPDAFDAFAHAYPERIFTGPLRVLPVSGNIYHGIIDHLMAQIVQRLVTNTTELGSPYVPRPITEMPLYHDLIWLAEVAQSRFAHEPNWIFSMYGISAIRTRADRVLSILALSVWEYTRQMVVPLRFMKTPVGAMISTAVVAPYNPEHIITPLQARSAMGGAKPISMDALDRLYREGLLATWYVNGKRVYVPDDIVAAKEIWKTRKRRQAEG